MPTFAMLCKKHQRSSTVQEEGLINEGMQKQLILHKQVHEQKSIAKSLYVYINRARLTACKVGVFSMD